MHLCYQILQLLDEFVDLSMTKLCPTHGKMEALEDYYQASINFGNCV